MKYQASGTRKNSNENQKKKITNISFIHSKSEQSHGALYIICY